MRKHAPFMQEMSIHSMPSMPEPEGAPVRHPHENEEWYQKWLRRQKNQPTHVIDIGSPGLLLPFLALQCFGRPQCRWHADGMAGAPQPQASTQEVAASSSGEMQAGKGAFAVQGAR